MQKEIPEGPPEYDIQIKQDIESPNPKDHTLIVKMNLAKQILAGITYFVGKKREHIRQLQLKEQTPQCMLVKARYEQYKKFDQKTKDEHRRQYTQIYKGHIDYQNFLAVKERYSYSLFQSFTDRGKNPNIKFTYQKNRPPQQSTFIIKFNKKYFFEQLKLTRRDLIDVPYNFAKIWDTDFIGFIRIIHKLLVQNAQRNSIYTAYLRSIDLISFTFDVVYYADKKAYRFRYSPFQFRNTQFTKEQYQLVGYYQSFSIIPQISMKSGYVLSTDQEFYHASRCFIFDDLTDNNTFVKVLQRTNIFYIAYLISKGSLTQGGLQADEYCKKYVWQLYFSTTRLKKFIYTWSFRPFKRITTRLQTAVKEIQLQTKQIILHVPFYFEVRDPRQVLKDDLPFRIRVQYQDFNRNMPLYVKEEIIHRVRDWYNTYKDNTINYRDITKQKNPAQQERILMQQKRERQKLKEAESERSKQKPDRQQTELEMYFGNRDRFDRFLLGLLVIVSSVLERNHFTMLDEKQRYNRMLEDTRYAILDTPQTGFVNKKHQHLHHYHWLQIHFQNKILPYLFKQQRQKTNLKASDTRYRCAQWKLHKVIKCKRQWNRKTEKAGIQNKVLQVLTLNEVFKDYIDILLKNFSLKLIYKDIINFIVGIGKNCYVGWEEHNIFDPNVRNQAIFKSIIAVILQQFYYNPLNKFKEKQLKALQKAIQQRRYIDKQQQEKVLEEQKLKKEDTIIEQFYRAVVVKILTKGDPGFMYDDKLFAQVTFRVMEYKSCWITRMNQGFIILRIYDDRIDFERQYEKVDSLKFNPKNKSIPFEEEKLKQKLQTLSSQIKTNVLS